MRSAVLTTTTLAAFIATAGAVPNQLPFLGGASGVIDKIGDSASSAISSWTSSVSSGVRQFETAVHANGVEYEFITHPDFPQYQIRMKEHKKHQSTMCDSGVKSYSGYLDIDGDTHLFFWAFESRSNPAKDPLVTWLNGGPGCSSLTGLLFELGPCAVANEGKNTTYNEYSWNSNANMIFLDSPVGVGYSYGGKTINNSHDTALDFYAFIQLFLAKFPKWQKNDFHVAGESYAGTYIPNIGSVIHNFNKNKPTSDSVHVNLKSLLIGNGLTDAYNQFASVPDYACKPSKWAIFDDKTCADIRGKVPTCQRLTKYCYSNPNRFTCVPATLSCWQIAGPIQQSGRNPYDVRQKCDREGEDGPLCYRQMQWMETFLNHADVKKELGVADDRSFTSCNMQINQAFTFNGDVTHDTASLIPPMLEDGIKILIYAGEADFMCNYMGNEQWMKLLPWSGQKKFAKEPLRSWSVGKKAAGNYRSYGPFTYTSVHEAGHMVPFDQPEAALQMFNGWIHHGTFWEKK